MDNKVIMSLSDYNALKRKADIMEQMITIEAYSTWVDCKFDPKLLAPFVSAKLRESYKEGELLEDEITMKPLNEWFGSVTVAIRTPSDKEE